MPDIKALFGVDIPADKQAEIAAKAQQKAQQLQQEQADRQRYDELPLHEKGMNKLKEYGNTFMGDIKHFAADVAKDPLGLIMQPLEATNDMINTVTGYKALTKAVTGKELPQTDIPTEKINWGYDKETVAKDLRKSAIPNYEAAEELARGAHGLTNDILSAIPQSLEIATLIGVNAFAPGASTAVNSIYLSKMGAQTYGGGVHAYDEYCEQAGIEPDDRTRWAVGMSNALLEVGAESVMGGISRYLPGAMSKTVMGKWMEKMVKKDGGKFVGDVVEEFAQRQPKAFSILTKGADHVWGEVKEEEFTEAGNILVDFMYKKASDRPDMAEVIDRTWGAAKGAFFMSVMLQGPSNMASNYVQNRARNANGLQLAMTQDKVFEVTGMSPDGTTYFGVTADGQQVNARADEVHDTAILSNQEFKEFVKGMNTGKDVSKISELARLRNKDTGKVEMARTIHQKEEEPPHYILSVNEALGTAVVQDSQTGEKKMMKLDEIDFETHKTIPDEMIMQGAQAEHINVDDIQTQETSQQPGITQQYQQGQPVAINGTMGVVSDMSSDGRMVIETPNGSIEATSDQVQPVTMITDGKTDIPSVEQEDGTMIVGEATMDKARTEKTVESLNKMYQGKRTFEIQTNPSNDINRPDTYQIVSKPTQEKQASQLPSELPPPPPLVNDGNGNLTPFEQQATNTESAEQEKTPLYAHNGNPVSKNYLKGLIRVADSIEDLNGIQIENDSELMEMVEAKFPQPKQSYTLNGETLDREEAMGMIAASKRIEQLEGLNIENDPELQGMMDAKFKPAEKVEQEITPSTALMTSEQVAAAPTLKGITKKKRKAEFLPNSRRGKLARTEPLSLRHAILNYFIQGGKVTTELFRREVSNQKGEYGPRFNLFSKEKGIDSEDIMQERMKGQTPFVDVDGQEFRNTLHDVLRDHVNVASMMKEAEKLISMAGNQVELSPEEARAAEEAEWMAQNEFNAQELSDDMINSYFEGEIIYNQIIASEHDNARTESQGRTDENGDRQDTQQEVRPGQARDTGNDGSVRAGGVADNQSQQPKSDNLHGNDGALRPTLSAGQHLENRIVNKEVERASSQVNQQPTDAQKEAGNYQKGHVKIHGLDISIENPQGSQRSGIDANGKAWEVTMNNAYGYFKRTEGKDGDQVDVFIGNHPTSEKVFVVDQVNERGEFDEHKVMLGFNSQEEATQAYNANYSKGWKGMGSITEMGMDEFKGWLKDGKRTKEPAAYHSSNADAKAFAEQSPMTDEQVSAEYQREAIDRELNTADVPPVAMNHLRARFGMHKGELGQLANWQAEKVNDAEKKIRKKLKIKKTDHETSNQVNEKARSYQPQKGQAIQYQLAFDFDNRGRNNDVQREDVREQSPSLRQLKPGEKAAVELKYTADKNFVFDGRNKIESTDDVAYLFRQLETKSVENMFACLVDENGKATVLHLSMGGRVGTVIDFGILSDAVHRMKPAKVYLIHNHPSGNLQQSEADTRIHRKAMDAFGDVMGEHIIINTTSGQYATFKHGVDHEIKDRPSRMTDERKDSRVIKMDKTIFRQSTQLGKITDPDAVARFLTAQRFSEGGKMSVMVLGANNGINAYVHTPFTEITWDNKDAIVDELQAYAGRFGGRSIILSTNAPVRNNEAGQVLAAIKKSLGNSDIALLDVVSIQNGITYSASNEGVMETAGEYLEARGKEKHGNTLSERKTLIETTVSDFNSKVQNPSKVVVVGRQSELAEAMKGEKKKVQNDAKTKGTVAAYYSPETDTIYMVAENLPDTREGIFETYAHEQLLHKGLRMLIPNRMKRQIFLKQIFDVVGNDTIMETIGESYALAPDAVKAEEYLAHVAEKLMQEENLTPQEKSVWDKFIERINDLILKVFGRKVNLNVEDLHSLIRASAQEVIGYVEQNHNSERPTDSMESVPQHHGRNHAETESNGSGDERGLQSTAQSLSDLIQAAIEESIEIIPVSHSTAAEFDHFDDQYFGGATNDKVLGEGHYTGDDWNDIKQYAGKAAAKAGLLNDYAQQVHQELGDLAATEFIDIMKAKGLPEKVKSPYVPELFDYVQSHPLPKVRIRLDVAAFKNKKDGAFNHINWDKKLTTEQEASIRKQANGHPHEKEIIELVDNHESGRDIIKSLGGVYEKGELTEPGIFESEAEAREFLTHAGFDGVISPRSRNGKDKGNYITFFDRDQLAIEEVGYFKLQPEQKNLVVLHNIAADQINQAAQNGGLIAPSVAITNINHPFTDFGDVTLIGKKQLIDPQNGDVKVFAGDVYSPSMPHPEWEVKNKELDKWIKKVQDKAYKLHRDFYSRIGNALGQYGRFRKDIGRTSAEGMVKAESSNPDTDIMLAYLIEKGVNVEYIEKDKPFYIAPNYEVKLTEAEKAEAKKMWDEHRGENDFYRGEAYQSFAKGVITRTINEKYGDLKEASGLAEKIVGNIGFASWANIGDAVNGRKETDNDSINKQIRSLVDEKEYLEWYKGKVNEYQGEKYFLQGKKKVPYTASNLLDSIVGKTRGQEKLMTFGINKAKSFAHKQLKSIDAIKKIEGILTSKTEMTKIDEAYSAEYFQLADKLEYQYSSTWDKMDDMGRSLADYYKGKNVGAALRKNGFVGGDFAAFKDFADRLKAEPVDYFEAKMQREVGLEEFAHAVVPEGSEAIETLKAKGVNVVTYKTPEERHQAILDLSEKDDEIRFKKTAKPNAKELDERYMKAIEENNLEEAQKIVDFMAKEKGYVSTDEYRMMHQAPNRNDIPAATLFENDIVPKDYWTHPHYYQYEASERLSFYKMKDAIEKYIARGGRGGVWMYRAVPKNVKDEKFRNGDWITPSEEYARSEGQGIVEGYRIIKQRVAIDNLWWDANSINEWGFDDGSDYVYKNTKNNRKLNDTITRDDDENIIPPSKRFNSRNYDVRFKKDLFFSPTQRALDNIKQEKATSQQWKSMLMKNGAKEAEMEWSGLNELLSQDKSFTKQKLYDTLEANKVELEEVVKEESNTLTKAEALRRFRNDEAVYGIDYEGNESLIEHEEDLSNYESWALEEGLSNSEVKYSSYKTHGGKNYKEWLLTLPSNEADKIDSKLDALKDEIISRSEDGQVYSYINDNPDSELTKQYNDLQEQKKSAGKRSEEIYKSSHWSEPNVAVHIRTQEFTDKDGKRVLLLDEVQSDWAQEGKKKGFANQKERAKAEKLEMLALTARKKKLTAQEIEDIDSELKQINVTESEFEQYIKDRGDFTTPPPYMKSKQSYNEGVADMPFKQTPQWVSLAFRRMLRHAAENGFDTVAWSTGKQNADRYSLSKAVKSVDWWGDENKPGVLRVFDLHNNVIYDNTIPQSQIAEVIGKEGANKIISATPQEFPSGVKRNISGEGLEVGGEGMKSFYDQIIPSVVSKAFKVKPTTTEIVTGDPIYADAGESMINLETGDLEPNTGQNTGPQTVTVHAIEISPELREKSFKPQPLFKKEWEQSGAAQAQTAGEALERLNALRGNKANHSQISEQGKAFSNKYRQPVVTVQTTRELPAHIQAKIYQGEERNIQAAVDPKTGIIYMVSQNLNPQLAEKALLHELLAHKGLREVLGEQFNPVLDKVYQSMNKADIRNFGDIYDTQDKRLIAEEYMAYLAESYKRPGMLQKIAAQIRDLLRKLFNINYSVNDIMHMLSKSEDFYNHQMKPEVSQFKDMDEYLDALNDWNRSDIRFKKTHPADLSQKGDKFIEAIQDRMISVKRLEDEVRNRGGKMSEFSMPYRQENLSHGRVKHAIEEVGKNQIENLKQSAADIINEKKCTLSDLQRYMKAKHAPERNKLISDRKGVNETNQSGFTTDQANQIVHDFENGLSQDQIDKLWGDVKALTTYTLDRYLKDGFITKETHDMISGMYEYYVPLRGHIEADATWDYQKKNMGKIINPYRKAEGRESESEDPIQYMINMAQTAIVMGERNKTKQHLYRLAANNDMPDLFKVKKIWYVETDDVDANGMNIVRETAEKPEQALFDAGKVTAKLNPRTQRIGVTLSQLKEHEVEVVINGAKHIVEMQNPEVARAINGDNVEKLPNWAVVRGIQNLTRWLSANYTSKNPAFIPINTMRDLAYASVAHGVKGEKGDMKRFLKNLPKAEKAMWDYQKGKGGKNVDLYKEFKENGAETGFIHSKDVDQILKEVEKDIKRLTGSNSKLDKAGQKALAYSTLNYWGAKMEEFATRSENLSRFATYLTARERGATPEQAAFEAKEITVNFNRKGKYTNALGAGFAFFNASLQGGANFMKMGWEHKGKFAAASGTFMAMGFLTAMAQMLNDDDEEEKNQWKYLSPYMRQNYLCIGYGKDQYLSLPLPQGFRAFYGMGVNVAEQMFGMEKEPLKLAANTASLFTGSVSPIDPVSFLTESDNGTFKFTGRPMMPTAIVPLYDVWTNRDFADRPVAKEPYTLNDKEMKAEAGLYRNNVNKVAKWMTDKVYEMGGGDTDLYTKYTLKNGKKEAVSNLADWNPSHLEHVIEGYTGGRGKFFNQLMKTSMAVMEGAVKSIQGEPDAFADFDTSDIPVLSRLNRQAYGKNVWEDYYTLKSDISQYESLKKMYEKEGIEIEDTPEWEKKRDILTDLKKELDELEKDEIDVLNDPKRLAAYKERKRKIMDAYLKALK